MTEPIDLASRRADRPALACKRETPPNSVYARVGDLVLHAAIQGVHRGESADEIIRHIDDTHSVALTRSELLVLLNVSLAPAAIVQFPNAAQRAERSVAPHLLDP